MGPPLSARLVTTCSRFVILGDLVLSKATVYSRPPGREQPTTYRRSARIRGEDRLFTQATPRQARRLRQGLTWCTSLMVPRRDQGRGHTQTHNGTGRGQEIPERAWSCQCGHPFCARPSLGEGWAGCWLGGSHDTLAYGGSRMGQLWPKMQRIIWVYLPKNPLSYSNTL